MCTVYFLITAQYQNKMNLYAFLWEKLLVTMYLRLNL